MSTSFAGAIVTRFAPSPTGHLHLGHAHSALLGWRTARAAGGRFLLRIEDIDRSRCRPEFEAAIYEDLAWLGLDWERPVRRQSEHFPEYRAALDRLREMDLVYPCFCSRKDIAAAASAPHGAPEPAPHGAANTVPHGAPDTAPHEGESVLYPGTCRALDPGLAAERISAGAAFALRLNVAEASRRAGPLSFLDSDPAGSLPGPFRETAARPERFGDVVLGRRDAPASYHLCAVLDDHLQGVTLVVRGVDLRPATHLHRLVQAVLGLATPRYLHHLLLANESGERLSKRDGAASLRAFRARGLDAEAVRAMAGFDNA